jgi:hypothetical protein
MNIYQQKADNKWHIDTTAGSGKTICGQVLGADTIIRHRTIGGKFRDPDPPREQLCMSCFYMMKGT